MKFLSFILFSTFLAYICSLEIYVDSTSNCSSDCGSIYNPFSTLPVAMYVFDQIVEYNQAIIANYSYMKSNFIINSSVHFILKPHNYSFNFIDINATRPCNPSIDECVFSYFLHSYVWNSDISIMSSDSNYQAYIKINTQRVKIYGNFSKFLSFYNIGLTSDFNEDHNFDLLDLGVYSQPYSLITLLPSTTDYQYGFGINFTNCIIQNFQQNTFSLKNHIYSHFIGFDYLLPSFSNMNNYYYIMMVNNSIMNNSFNLGSFIFLRNTYFILLQCQIQNFGTYPLLNITSPLGFIFNSIVIIDNDIFVNSSSIIAYAENCKIIFENVSIVNNDIYSHYQDTWMILLNYNVTLNITNVLVGSSYFGGFLFAKYENMVIIDNLNFVNVQANYDLFSFNESNSFYLLNMTIFDMTSQNTIFVFNSNNNASLENIYIMQLNFSSANYYSYPLVIYLVTNNMINMNILSISKIYSFYTIFCVYQNNRLKVSNIQLNYAYYNIDVSHGIVFFSYGTNNLILFQSIQISNFFHNYAITPYSFFQCNQSCYLIVDALVIDKYFTGFEYLVFLGNACNNANVNVSMIVLTHLFPPDRIVYNSYNYSSLISNQNVITVQAMGYYINYTNNYLHLCGDNCLQCINNTYCYSCNISTNISNGLCYNYQNNTCGLGFYYNYSYGYCQHCISNCDYCSSSYSCDECSSGYSNNYYNCNYNYVYNCSIYNGSYGCQQCNYGYYLVSPYYCGSCQILTPGCSYCLNNGTNNSGCYNCSYGYYLQSKNINNSYYPTCISCNTTLANCASCYNSSYCQYCENGYVSKNGVCQSCAIIFPNCESCNDYNCLNCFYGYYIKNTTCVANHFALNFQNGIVGQFYHFFSQQCLSNENLLNSYSNGNERNLFVPCNGYVTSDTLFMIKQVTPYQYIILPWIHINSQLYASCQFSYIDYRAHFSLALNPFNTNNSSYNSSNKTSDNSYSYSTYNSTNSNNSSNSNKTNNTPCPTISNFSCESYWDSYDYNQCFPTNDQTSLWDLQKINDANTFGDSKYAFLLKNIKLNNFCLSYSDDGWLKYCDSSNFDFLFGFKIIYINFIENQIFSTLTGSGDTVAIKWTDNMNSSNISYVIYYFDDYISFNNYLCGSDKSNSPVYFNQTHYPNGSNIISVNLTLNNMMSCGVRTYEDSTYIYFDLKAAVSDTLNKYIYVDFYHIRFMKLSEYDGQSIYVGYTNDSNSDAEIVEDNETTVTLNVSTYLNVNINNLISNKYLKKNVSQSIVVSYSSNNRFKMSLLNNIVSFVVIGSDKNNKSYNINATFSNNISNEIVISFDVSSLVSGYYKLQFDIYFQMMARRLAQNSAEPNNFTSTYVNDASFFIGSTDEVNEKIKIDSENNNNLTNDENNLDSKVIIIAVVTSVFGFLLILIPAIYFFKKYRKAKKVINPKKKKEKINNSYQEGDKSLAKMIHLEDKSPELFISNNNFLKE